MSDLESGASASPADVARAIRLDRILVIALASGLLIYVAYLFWDARQRQGLPPAPGAGLPVVALVFLGVAAGAVGMGWLVPHIVFMQLRQRMAQGLSFRLSFNPVLSGKTDDEQLLEARRTCMIIRCAFLEAAGFGNGVAFMLAHSPYSLAVAAAMVAGIALQFPHAGRTAQWLDEQRRWLETERALNQLRAPR